MTQLNEIKRMQQLAGILTESQLNEGIIDLSQDAVDLLMDKTKFATKPGSSTGVFTIYDLSRPKGAASFGDDMASQKVGFLWTPESKYKAYKLESDDENTVKKITALKESQLNENNFFGFSYKNKNKDVDTKKLMAMDEKEAFQIARKWMEKNNLDPNEIQSMKQLDQYEIEKYDEITESQLNEEPREGIYNDFNKWKASFPEDTEFKQENNYMMAFDKSNKELGKWNPVSIMGSHADDFQYKNLEEALSKTYKVIKTAESIEQAVNEALKAYRKKK